MDDCHVEHRGEKSGSMSPRKIQRASRRARAGSRRIAVIAAHPDDEVLGCGATIARHALAGHDVSVLILAEGVTSRFPTRNRRTAASGIAQLARSARAAHAILGSVEVQFLRFPDNRMDQVPLLDVVKAVELFLTRTRPQVVYTHFAHDLNLDHRVVSLAVETACRPLPALPGGGVETILCFEVASSTEWRWPGASVGFVPNYFVDVTATWDRKVRALAAYRSEMRPWPHPRSLQGIEHLARWRGATIGCPAAEAFVLARALWR
jgi:LmbE family N-acetylglucosaminyl deacetylase